MISRFFRHLWESIKSLKRNGWMTIAAIGSVTITLSLVAIFASVILNTAKIATDIENNVRVNVYLRVDSTDAKEEVTNDAGENVANDSYHLVYNQIESIDNIDTISYSSKEEQLEQLKAQYGDTWSLFDGDANPLYDTYIVETTAPSHVEAVADEIAQIDGVSQVAYGGANTEKLFKLASNIRLWGSIGTGLLLLVAVFLISNTVRITIISRSREIQIMRLVGAKNSYIRGPFFLEGAWVGMLGAILPSVMIYFVYQIAYKGFLPQLVSQNLSMLDPTWFTPAMIGGLFVIGILIGSFGSVISMRRFLKI